MRHGDSYVNYGGGTDPRLSRMIFHVPNAEPGLFEYLSRHCIFERFARLDESG